MTDVKVASRRRDEYITLLEAAGVGVVESGEVLLADPVLVNELDLGSMRWIQSTWAGVDAIDWSRVPPDVVITTLPGVFGPQITEFVFAHLLGRTQRVPARHASRTWDETPPGTLRGSIVGILGAGSIGSAIAEAAQVFGMTVRGCRRSGAQDGCFDRMYSMSELDEFAAGLDHLVVVLPSTTETHHLVDASLLGRLSHGATLINVGRGSTVDTQAVLELTRSGRLGLAVLDVTDPEPLQADHPAWSVPNIVITGHTAAISRPQDIVQFFVANLARFEAGEPLTGLVDRSKGY